ncbi:MAG: response regulator [Deltaproteobacteria bacterium]|nr:response regulator [Deltaproteobacteria bacterium]MBW2120928.1 response regulator [Deltaproteobacteria bacterium]
MDEFSVLVVDDEQEVRQTLSEMIEGLGYQVLVAGGGEEALRRIRDEKVDLVITDLSMPGLNGLDLILASKEINPSIPIAVISAFGSVENTSEALTRGAFSFVAKPFKLPEIRELVRKGRQLRELSLGTYALMEWVQSQTEMVFPSQPHLFPSAILFAVKECQWRGMDDEGRLENVAICLEELLSNAYVHGNRRNGDKRIRLKMSFDAEKFVLSVRDEGEGFDGENYLGMIRGRQPSVPEKRGLFIVDLLADELRFNGKGDEVTAVMYREKRPAGR